MIAIKNKILSGPEPLVNYPETYSTLGNLLLQKLKSHGEKLCMIDSTTEEKLTYRDILRKTIQAAESLKSLKLSKDDVVAICSENNTDFFVPVIAAMYLGLTVAPLNDKYTYNELYHCFYISKPKVVFCSASVLNNILKLGDELEYLKYIYSYDWNMVVPNLRTFCSLSPLVNDLHIDKFEVEHFDGSQKVAYILCSSGTTGLPKGVMITHHNMLCAIGNLNDTRYYAKKDTSLSMLPLFHVFGLLTTYSAITCGEKIVVMKKFDLEEFLRCVQNYKIKYLMLVPPLVVLLAKSPVVDKYDLSNVEAIGCAAAPLGKDIEDIVKIRLKLKLVEQGYGLTESTTAVLKTPICDDPRSGSVGTVMPCMQYKIVDLEHGHALGPNLRGELCLKGSAIMKGYYGMEEATKQVIDDQGWLHTGDIAYYDEDGYFYIVDRLKELIKYKGFQVPPAELEQLLLAHPSIKDAAVIGKPDEFAGELPLAFVVKVPGQDITEAQVQQFISKQVSPQKRLHGGVRFVEEIPKNPSGKILRRKLRELLQLKSKL